MFFPLKWTRLVILEVYPILRQTQIWKSTGSIITKLNIKSTVSEITNQRNLRNQKQMLGSWTPASNFSQRLLLSTFCWRYICECQTSIQNLRSLYDTFFDNQLEGQNAKNHGISSNNFWVRRCWRLKARMTRTRQNFIHLPCDILTFWWLLSLNFWWLGSSSPSYLTRINQAVPSFSHCIPIHCSWNHHVRSFLTSQQEKNEIFPGFLPICWWNFSSCLGTKPSTKRPWRCFATGMGMMWDDHELFLMSELRVFFLPHNQDVYE